MAVQVEKVTKTKSGKGLRVLLSGTWYNAFLDSGLEAQVGKMIEAEIRTHDKFGAGVHTWKPVNAAPQVATALAAATPPSPAAAAPYKYAEPNLNVAPWWMPFVSNTVAHAIQAGHVNNPQAIKAWAVAAKEAARVLVSQTPTTQDEDIPF